MLYKRFIWVIKICFPDCPGHVWPEKLIEAGGAMQKVPLNSIWSRKKKWQLFGKISVHDNVNHMIIDPDVCVYDACMKDAYIHNPRPWCMYPWCGIFSRPTNGRTDEQGDSRSWILESLVCSFILWVHSHSIMISGQWKAKDSEYYSESYFSSCYYFKEYLFSCYYFRKP